MIFNCSNCKNTSYETCSKVLKEKSISTWCPSYEAKAGTLQERIKTLQLEKENLNDSILKLDKEILRLKTIYEESLYYETIAS